MRRLTQSCGRRAFSHAQVIHNLEGWADDKPNNCVINAAPLLPGVAVDPTLVVRNVTLRNIASEGATLCAMRIAVEMTYHDLLIENLAIDAWNGLGAVRPLWF